MAKRVYYRPTILPVEETDDPTIVIGGSSGTSGYDSQWSFSGIDQDTLDLIELNCDDTDLAEMDANGDLEITLAEFQAWYDANKPW